MGRADGDRLSLKDRHSPPDFSSSYCHCPGHFDTPQLKMWISHHLIQTESLFLSTPFRVAAKSNGSLCVLGNLEPHPCLEMNSFQSANHCELSFRPATHRPFPAAWTMPVTQCAPVSHRAHSPPVWPPLFLLISSFMLMFPGLFFLRVPRSHFVCHGLLNPWSTDSP